VSGVNRIQERGRINRGTALRFYYDGRQYFGHQGDTLASALLANAVYLVGRSFKYHRPRGIMGAGVEEPNALVQLEKGAYTQPNVKATEIELYDGLIANSQNCWPSVRFDVGVVNSWLGRFLPAGFYYKTFMWPASLWMTYEHFIRKAAGLGVSPRSADPDRYEQAHRNCDVLIVGGGPAGLSAALAAGRAGADVLLIDEQAEFGGDLLSTHPASGYEIDGAGVHDWLKQTVRELTDLANVKLISRCTVSGYYDYNYLTALERVTDHYGPLHVSNKPRQKFWKIRAKRVVLCTGAIERPLLFADNDRPGVMLASAIRTYVNRYCVLPGKSICLFTNNDSTYQTALDSQRAGAKITVVDVRENPQGSAVRLARDAGVRVLTNSAISRVVGKHGVSSVDVKMLSEDGKSLQGSAEQIECQIVGSSGGWNPTVHLFSQARGKVSYNESIASFVPDINTCASINPSRVAGGIKGSRGLGTCLQEGFEAGSAAAKDCSFTSASAQAPQATDFAEGPQRVIWVIPTDHPIGQGSGKHFHDFQNDVTVADIHLAAREGFVSVEHLKRYTTTGMATDQGKTSNVNALAIMAENQGVSIPEVGTTTFRPPYTPVTFGAVTGQHRRALFLQNRKTPMHSWHVANRAVFEDVGDWKRPRYFPRRDEDMHSAVQRESRHVREAVGVLDASTLGKIDIQGRDAAEFLNRIYTNGWLKLGVGKCRYGLMLNEHGMVFDDGVTTRLGEQHFHMTTTTGGAARVLNWLEEWLQTEWPELQVYCTSVTEQWAVVAVNGPHAKALLGDLCDNDFSNAAFPHMSYQAATVAGIAARIFRISFTGEQSYEVNVPARYGLALWEALVSAGRRYDLCVYGTETMHLLRAEKGFIIVGQDTDGTVTPADLGMQWIINNNKPDFLGKRSFSRSDTAREGRKQLVGILTESPDIVLPEGAHFVTQVRNSPPMETEGHVTSSYYSPNLDRSIALALLKDGRSRVGEVVTARLIDGQNIKSRVVDPVFFDTSGERIDG